MERRIANLSILQDGDRAYIGATVHHYDGGVRVIKNEIVEFESSTLERGLTDSQWLKDALVEVIENL